MSDFNSSFASFLDGVRAFADQEVAPNAREWDRKREFPAHLWERAAKASLLGITAPTEFGGLDAPCTIYCEACRELSKADAAFGMNIAAINALAIGHLRRFGSAAQQSAYIPRLVSAEIQGAWALTEPEAGSDPKRIATRGTPLSGEPGRYRVTGEKMFITNALKADVIVVIGRDEKDSLTAFIIETNQPGFVPVERIMTVGVAASQTGRFRLEDASAWHTPCDFAQATSMLHRGRLGIASMALGIAERALELAIEWAKKREQFGRSLGDMQSIQNFIADSTTEIEASRLLIRDGAERYDRGEDIMKASSMAKLFASETANRVTNRAIQIYGGRGMSEEFLVEKLWRDSKLTEIGEGTSEIQRLIISKHMLR